MEETFRVSVRELVAFSYFPEDILPAADMESMLIGSQAHRARQAAKQAKKDQWLREQEEKRPTHEKYMKDAIRQAKKAAALGEVPIGCVIVHDGQVIGRGYNRRNTDKSTLAHAEITAIKRASKKLGDWRLEDCTLYVTLEPCQMCAGALMQSRIDRVVIGSMNPKAGCAGSVLNLLEMDGFNHKVEVIRGVLQEECSSMLSDFFKELREKKKMLKKSLAEQVGNSEK